MKPVPIDLFCHLKYPAALRAGPNGAFTYITRQADMEANGYQTTLWLHRGGRPTRLTEPGELAGHWWAGEDALLLARPGTDREKGWAKKGLPYTLLQTLPLNGPGEAQDVARLFLAVEDALALPGGGFLLLAGWDPAADAALAKTGHDAEKAAALLAEEADYEVLTCLPFWENGGGFTGQKRQRLYLFKDGKTTPLTDELTNVDFVRLSPSGKTAWFTARRYQTRMPPKDRLFRLDLATLGIVDLTFCDPFVHEAVVPLSDDSALVAGCDMQTHGVNQNVGFYRLQAPAGGGKGGKKKDAPPAGTAPAGTVTPLYEGGAYGTGNSVGTDLSMASGTHGACWTLDGGWVWWVTTINESSHLMRIDPQGGAIEQVSREAGAVQAFVRTGGATVAVAMRNLAGPEVFRIADDGKEKRLTGLNTGLARRFAFAQPQPLAFTSAEGTQIRGWVIRPTGLEGKKRCPAILDIHGGPKTVYGPVLFHEMQYWAALGYAVIYCNPTGGDGRGDDFADLRGRYGSVDYTDIMGFVDAALAACPFIDPERLGVTGGSYGGFMTNWIIGHTTRFKAAASQRSISNWISMGTFSDIGYFFTPSEMKGVTLWEDTQKWWDHSPLKYAPNVKTPTLFIHSDEDYRCPLPEGLQMYSALVDLGVETRLCLFHGENHELSRSGKPKHRLRRLREITEWFQNHL